MFNHEPSGYRCPFCLIVAGGGDGVNDPRTVVTRSELALAVISLRWWPNNPGHALAVPTAHYENLYDIPPAAGHAVHDLVREIAIAMRTTYSCDGISTRQHNEPAGSQDVWHFHVHVFPRYRDDRLYETPPLPEFGPLDERIGYAEKLRAGLGR